MRPFISVVRCLFKELVCKQRERTPARAAERKTYVDAVEQTIVVILILLEYAHVLEDLLVDLDTVVVPDGVFAQEVEGDVIFAFVVLERDVLATQRTTADGVRLVLALLVTRTKGKFVDEVHGRRALALGHDFRLEVVLVVAAYAIDVVLAYIEYDAV